MISAQKHQAAFQEKTRRSGLVECFNWWRRGESNPRPQILCLWPYMLSLIFNLTVRNPTGRATNGGSGEF